MSGATRRGVTEQTVQCWIGSSEADRRAELARGGDGKGRT